MRRFRVDWTLFFIKPWIVVAVLAHRSDHKSWFIHSRILQGRLILLQLFSPTLRKYLFRLFFLVLSRALAFLGLYPPMWRFIVSSNALFAFSRCHRCLFLNSWGRFLVSFFLEFGSYSLLQEYLRLSHILYLLYSHRLVSRFQKTCFIFNSIQKFLLLQNQFHILQVVFHVIREHLAVQRRRQFSDSFKEGGVDLLPVSIRIVYSLEENARFIRR